MDINLFWQNQINHPDSVARVESAYETKALVVTTGPAKPPSWSEVRDLQSA